MPYHKYNDDAIIEAIKTSKTRREVMTKIGMSSAHSSYRNLNRRIAALGLDISHFSQKDRSWGGQNRKSPEERLVLLPEGSCRTAARLLRKALTAIGRPYECQKCGLTEWLGESITLQVDHEDGDGLNNRPNNLRYLCPNCHSQTNNFGFKNRTLPA